EGDGITVRVRGPETSGGRVDAAVYARFLQDVLTCIRRVESRVRCEGEAPVRFQIGKMHASAPTLTLTPVAQVAAHGRRVVSAYMRTVRQLEDESAHPQHADVPTLQSFRKLAGYLRSGLAAIELRGHEESVNVTHCMERSVDRLLGMQIRSHGTLSGRLEYINAHEGLKCRIYPRIGPTYVECTFAQEMLPEIAAGLKRYVTVEGTLHYHGFEDFPHRIDATRVIVHPPEDELPGIDALWGLAPNVTAGRPVEEYIRELRDADE
ncbi:MAG: hypothetical protein ACOCX2_10190, partial [Armatimonadota bacterium]